MLSRSRSEASRTGVGSLIPANKIADLTGPDAPPNDAAIYVTDEGVFTGLRLPCCGAVFLGLRADG